MKPGRFAAADGSFGRSAGAAMGRGVGLLVVALILGVFLLNATDNQPPGTTLSSGSASTPRAATPGHSSATIPTTSTTVVTPIHAPKDVKVVVANASPTNGAGQRASDALKTAGYNTLSPTNATSTKDSAVFYTPGYDREAAAVAQALGFAATAVKPMPSSPPVTDLRTASILVVVGSDMAAKFAGATTTTTAAHAAATTTAPKSPTTTAKTASTSTTVKH
jgi:hypothetical protein